MLRKSLFAGLALVLLLTIGIIGCAKPEPTTPTEPTPAPSPEVIELKFAYTSPPQGTMAVKIHEPWAREIESLSNGRVKITSYGAGSLVKTPGEYDAVLSRVCDIAFVTPSNTPGIFPLSEATGLPLIFDSAEAGSAAHMELIEKYLMDAEFKDVKVLYATRISPNHISTSTKQMKTLEDFQGQKFGVTAEGAVRFVEKAGGTPVMMPIPELYTSLERGMVDACIEPWAAHLSFKIFEVTKYRTSCGLTTYGGLTVMNLDSWNSLPTDIKGVFEQNGFGETWVEQSQFSGATFDAVGQELLEGVIMPYDQEKGNPNVYYLPEDERARWREICQPIYEEWVADMEAKGLPATAFFNDLLELAQKYNLEVAGK